MGLHMSMKDLPEFERPYEKLEYYGSEVLSDAELLAIIFRTGSKNIRAVELAQKLLALEKQEGLYGLYQYSIEELMNINGIGKVKALQIKAVLELSKRISKRQGMLKYKINSPKSIASIYMEEMRYLKQEYFKIVILNTKNQIIGDKNITKGSINSSIVHPREIFKYAIKKSATSIIMIHNHPSGDPNPSKEDIQVTKRIVDGGELLGINILDHIIIGDGIYISLKEKGII
ncbi:RadC family protein [Defluviitalea phaphyphila]|uniref:RadC family protein n=1 Tax=Defluviitalea phaphyphila TaxID=1473580 RepID=UPI000730B0E6|nr:DNA repair protein RadC [Defluviitalea phaphyphila]